MTLLSLVGKFQLPPPDRPRAIIVVAALETLLGAIAVVDGTALIFVRSMLPLAFLSGRFFTQRPIFSGLGLVLFAAISFLLAYGVWKGKGWIWVWSLILAALGVFSSIVLLFIRPRAGQLVSLIADLLILYCLIQPRVQCYFGRGAVSLVGTTIKAIH